VRDEKKLNKLKGVHVAFNTAYDASGDVSPDAAGRLARCYKKAGVDGLYVCGSTGEGVLLTVEERMKTLEAVVEEVGGEMTVMAHIGAAATRHSIALAKHAASLNVDAISSIPCVYYKISEAEIKRNWLAMIEAVDVPFVIYNIPGTTGYDISMSLFSEMAATEQVYGIKNTTMNAYQILQFRRAAGKDFIIFNGPDEQYLAGRLMGADGGIGGSYGSMPELFVTMEQSIQKGDIERAQRVQVAIDDIIPQMYALSSFCGAAKEIIKTRFVDIGEPRMPLAPLTEEDRREAKVIAGRIEEYIETL
jgi:N-acetylneuraminate lyase